MSGVLVLARAAAIEAAARAGFVGVLEVEVERALAAQRVRRTSSAGERLPERERLVDLSNRSGGLRAHVRRIGTTPAGRIRWNVLDVEPRDRPTTNGGTGA